MKSAIMDISQSYPALPLLRIMEESRQGDRREGILLRQNRGIFQVAGMGHEAIAVLSFLLGPEDFLFPYYRDRALCIARGLSTYEIALSFFAREDVNGSGRPMHGHYSSRPLNIFSIATPTSSQCLPAVGCAWNLRRNGEHSVVLCTIGDASLRQGEYFEAVAFAIQEKLPIVFVVEDNLYGISTNTIHQNPYRLGVFNDEHYVRLDGRVPDVIYRHGVIAVEKARAGEGPTVLWCELDRLCSHTSSDDQRVYRPEQDLEDIILLDPIAQTKDRLIQEGVISAEEWECIKDQIALKVERDYLKAEEAPLPSTSALRDHMMAQQKPIDLDACIKPADADSVTMVTAINDTLRHTLETDPRVIMMGEDIEDPKGGVFGLTKGLSSSFPGRVLNSPLAEATIIGTAVGLAATGAKPIFEIQFIDFITTGFNQLSTQVSTLRWRTCGAWTCPMVLLAPCGAYLPGGGPWHSQTNEGIWAHLAGIEVVSPSTPEDAAGLLLTAIESDNPTLYLIPKHIFRKREASPESFAPIPFGKLAIRREGTDVTLVSWGNCIEVALEVADQAQSHGISVEVLDLRTLVPCDWEGICASLLKTGRLLVIEEDAKTGSFGQTIISEIVTKPERWNLLSDPPVLLAREDVPVPFAPHLEYASLPDVDRTLKALLDLVHPQ